jgi:hypothetical protein
MKKKSSIFEEKKWRKMMKKFFGLVGWGNEDDEGRKKVVETMELNLNLSEEKVV